MLTDNIVTLIVQVIFIWKVDMSTVKNVLWFNIATITPTFIVGAFWPHSTVLHEADAGWRGSTTRLKGNEPIFVHRPRWTRPRTAA